MGYEIEKGVPVKGEIRTRYPFADMDPNDSFLVECEEDKRRTVAANLSASARRFRESHYGRRYTVRRVEGGVRCWRVE